MSSNGKPTPQPPAAGAGGPPKMYQRPIYRPQQGAAKRRHGRSCPFSCCCCFFWAVLVILLLAFVAAVVGGTFYLMYRPHRPAFTLSVARVSKLSVSSSATAPTLTDTIDFTVTARNPNKKLVYFYDDFTVTAATAANAVPLGEATVLGFAHQAGNITVINGTVSASALTVDPAAASSDIKKPGSTFPITLDLETKAGVKVGGLKTKKIGIQVHCDDIKVTAPAPPPLTKKKKLTKGAADAPSKSPAKPAADAPSKSPSNATVADAPSPAAADDETPSAATATTTTTVARVCQVRIRIKIWKWTF